MKSQLRFGIITPTYQREVLLEPFIRAAISQTYRHWDLCVVHDGENVATRSVIDKFVTRDPRVHYLETMSRSNNFGVTPRLEGITRGLNHRGCDYLVFWDDDNLFFRNALKTIVRALAASNYPDLLLVPIHYRGTTLPLSGVPVDCLQPGMLDTANLVVRFDIACRHYQSVQELCKSGADSYGQDFLFFDEIRRAVPHEQIAIALCKPIGPYDGMLRNVRIGHIRRSLKIPELYILSRIPWYRSFLAKTSKAR